MDYRVAQYLGGPPFLSPTCLLCFLVSCVWLVPKLNRSQVSVVCPVLRFCLSWQWHWGYKAEERTSSFGASAFECAKQGIKGTKNVFLNGKHKGSKEALGLTLALRAYITFTVQHKTIPVSILLWTLVNGLTHVHYQINWREARMLTGWMNVSRRFSTS